MACRRLITNYCVNGQIKAVRSLPTIATRTYSTDRDEITEPTHTGQVNSLKRNTKFALFSTVLSTKIRFFDLTNQFQFLFFFISWFVYILGIWTRWLPKYSIHKCNTLRQQKLGFVASIQDIFMIIHKIVL